jgi:hypothetical protein
MANQYWMIKWNPEDKSSKDLVQDWLKFLNSNPPEAFDARILRNPNHDVERLNSQLFEEVKECDVIFAYQAGSGELHGFCIVTKRPYRDSERWIPILPILRLERAIPLLQLKQKYIELQSLECLQPGLPRTLYKLSKSDADLLFSLCPGGIKREVTQKVNNCANRNRSTAGF